MRLREQTLANLWENSEIPETSQSRNLSLQKKKVNISIKWVK